MGMRASISKLERLTADLFRENLWTFLKKLPERGDQTAGRFRYKLRFFLQNNRDSHDLGRLACRSNGQEYGTTWIG